MQILETVERKRSKMNMVGRMDMTKAREAGERERIIQQEVENKE